MKVRILGIEKCYEPQSCLSHDTEEKLRFREGHWLIRGRVARGIALTQDEHKAASPGSFVAPQVLEDFFFFHLKVLWGINQTSRYQMAISQG